MMKTSFKPSTLKEALKIRNSGPFVPYLGGTDLMVENDLARQYLFLGDLKELQNVYRDEEGLHIGAGMTYTKLLALEDCPPLLKKAIAQIASPAIRNRATIGGNVCNASPAGDTLPVLLIYDAVLTLESVSGPRRVRMEDFILSRKHIDLREDEILTAITLRNCDFNRNYYHKIGSRKAMSISKIALAGAAKIQEEKIGQIAVAFASMYKTPLRFKDIEDQMTGHSLEDLFRMREEIVHAYAERLHPIDDLRSTAVYRKQVALRLIRDFLESLKSEGD